MYYYPHHIGDFRSGTVNMTRNERWIYRDLLDVYYDSETPLSLDLDIVCNEIGVRTDDERTIVASLLRFKFDKGPDGYRNERCDREILAYHLKAETAKANGRLGGRKSNSQKTQSEPSGFQPGFNPVASGSPVACESQANQEPITNNQINKEAAAKKQRGSPIPFKTFLENCKTKNEKPISSYKPVFEYASKVGLPDDFIEMCWNEFYRRYDSGGPNDSKRYTDWRKAFRICVESNWFKLWWFNPATNTYELTTQGHSAQRAA